MLSTHIAWHTASPAPSQPWASWPASLPEHRRPVCCQLGVVARACGGHRSEGVGRLRVRVSGAELLRARQPVRGTGGERSVLEHAPAASQQPLHHIRCLPSHQPATHHTHGELLAQEGQASLPRRNGARVGPGAQRGGAGGLLRRRCGSSQAQLHIGCAPNACAAGDVERADRDVVGGVPLVSESHGEAAVCDQQVRPAVGPSNTLVRPPTRAPAGQHRHGHSAAAAAAGGGQHAGSPAARVPPANRDTAGRALRARQQRRPSSHGSRGGVQGPQVRCHNPT